VLKLLETGRVNSRDSQITDLRTAIAAQEAMRPKFGDATVDLSLKPLHSLLDSLLAQQAVAHNVPSHDELLAQLQSYIPKQLADKIRSSGHVEGERRQVTVIFADISGFTALSERLDPEEVALFSNDCMKELIDAVYQYEGMVDKFIGDCIMAVFGAPIALEDDAERALRATLSMRERLEAFNRKWIDKLKEPLALHIGINSGTVIAGNVGNDLRMSYTVMGDTVNVASRLEGAATRGQIFVSQSTHRLTHGAFTFRALEPIRVKGKSDLLTVYELLGAKILPDQARGLEGLVSPLMGRTAETTALE
jgi:adenylate cyclase